jgi:hypothetical protein
MTSVTQAGEECGCGCECCGDGAPKTRDEQIAELTALRQSIDRRLGELAS